MCSLCRLPVAENHNFLTNFEFLGAPVQTPFPDEGQIWCATADPQSTFMCQNSSQSVYSIALWRRKKKIFAIFWTSAFSDVDSWRQSEKVEHGCTTTNLPLSNGIKIISVLQRLHGEIRRTNSDVQKRDGQTKKPNVCRHPGSGWNPSPTKHGMVIEDIEHVLAPLNCLGSDA